MKVGFIGAGRMGRPMVARLVGAGHDVWALARTAEQRRHLEQLGAAAVNEVAEAGAQADVVVLCLFADEQVRRVCLDSALLPTMPSGSALVVHTTTSPKTIEAIAARADEVDIVDAPVSGGPHDIAAGKLTLFVGGADDTVARLRPVLGCYGDPILHVGPSGAGQKVKLVNNALFAGHVGLLAEAIRLGQRLGVPESTLLAALPHGSAASRVLNSVAARGSVASFSEVAGEFVGKDVAVVRSIAEELGSDLGVLDDAIQVINVAGKVSHDSVGGLFASPRKRYR
jgi:3-hydroxyisobutyrate dehydrogenase-like beta-hydroxyacid dehydrogenase